MDFSLCRSNRLKRDHVRWIRVSFFFDSAIQLLFEFTIKGDTLTAVVPKAIIHVTKKWFYFINSLGVRWCVRKGHRNNESTENADLTIVICINEIYLHIISSSLDQYLRRTNQRLSVCILANSSLMLGWFAFGVWFLLAATNNDTENHNCWN